MHPFYIPNSHPTYMTIGGFLNKVRNKCMTLAPYLLLAIYIIMEFEFLVSYTSLTLIETEIERNPYKYSDILVNEYSNKIYFYYNISDKSYETSTDTYDLVTISKNMDTTTYLASLFKENYHNKTVTFKKNDVNVLAVLSWNIIYIYIIYTIGSYLYGSMTKKANIGEETDDNDISFSSLLKNHPLLSNESNFQVIKPGQFRSSNSMDSIIGCDMAKDDLKEYVNQMINWDYYNACGIEHTRGILFVGPSGTGKTMMARAFAEKSHVSFIPCCGSDFVNLYVGSGAKSVRKLFELARKNQPCIIFIDEIDSLGSRKMKSTGGSEEEHKTLNAILSEMNGFKEGDAILVIGATNFANRLDTALVRSGRFDKKVYFDLPNIKERKLMFEYYLSKIVVDSEFTKGSDENLAHLCKMTAGLSGADIKNIVNQGMINYMKQNGLEKLMEKMPREIKGIDVNSDTPVIVAFEERIKMLREQIIGCEMGASFSNIVSAIDECVVGMVKRERLMSSQEKEIVAIHEAGHTLIGCLFKNGDIPLKTSIIPRGENALGFTQMEPDDRKLNCKEDLISKMCTLLGGRCAEEVVFGSNNITTGASDDFQRVVKLVRVFVMDYGMHVELCGTNSDNYDQCSEWLKSKIDQICVKTTNDCYILVKKVLSDNMEYLEKISTKLLENEEIFKDDISNIVPAELYDSIIGSQIIS